MQQTLEIGAFVKNQVPLLSALKQSFAAGTYKSLTDLAALTQADWLKLINASGAGAVPANISAAGSARPGTSIRAGNLRPRDTGLS